MRTHLLLITALALTATLFTTTAAAADDFGKVVAGYVERVGLHPWDVQVKAKLDTGANTSSIYAVDVHRFKKDDEKWVRFTLVLEDYRDKVHRIETEAKVVRNIRIKDHNDPSSRRAVIALPMCFDGRLRDVEFSLANRKAFIYPVLLGRRFLSGVAVIDPEKTFLTQPACERAE